MDHSNGMIYIYITVCVCVDWTTGYEGEIYGFICTCRLSCSLILETKLLVMLFCIQEADLVII